ncbi:MAG: glycoside hydrolase family 5 protein [Ruminococcaceae bacterium]|nr:glycoside hydrolase family 5 protein [Oscillospiraceae bacterium]
METFLSDNPYGFFERGIDNVTKESTYTNIKAQGFDHVRIPVNFYTAYYEASTGNYDYTTEQIMQYVDTGIELAIKNDLYVILDFHGWFYIGEEQNDIEEFLYCWTQVANRYKDYSDKLIFELLNEPWYTNGAPQKYLSDSALNKMQADAIKIIRDTGSNNADRLIICCTADGNKAWKLSALSLPDDDNLAVAIHEYAPYNFTHQNFSWAGLGGQTTTLAAQGGFESATSYDFGEIKKFMEKTGIPVVLNEFGVNLDKATDADIKTYLSGITTFCKDNNIPWTYWQYYGEYDSEGSMSLYRKTSLFSTQKWDETALDALFLR